MTTVQVTSTRRAVEEIGEGRGVRRKETEAEEREAGERRSFPVEKRARSGGYSQGREEKGKEDGTSRMCSCRSPELFEDFG